MRNPFRKRTRVADPDTDPIAVTHEMDPSLDDDEMILHTTIDPESIKENDE